MRNRFGILVWLLCLGVKSLVAQGDNPGVFNKKNTVGYNLSYCVPKTLDLFKSTDNKFGMLLTHSFYAEHALSKYTSLQFTFSTQKCLINGKRPYGLLSETNYHEIPIDDENIYMTERVMGGTSSVKSNWYGLRYNWFNAGSTIASPIGKCVYLKADLYQNQLVKNNFEMLYESNLSDSELEAFPKPQYINIKSSGVSLGGGTEIRMLINKYMYFHCNLEMNFSLKFINVQSEMNYKSTMYDEIKLMTGYSSTIKNLLLVGTGIGFLL